MAGGRALYKKEVKAKKEARGDDLKAAFNKAVKAYEKAGSGGAEKAEVYRTAREYRKATGKSLQLPGGL